MRLHQLRTLTDAEIEEPLAGAALHERASEVRHALDLALAHGHGQVERNVVAGRVDVVEAFGLGALAALQTEGKPLRRLGQDDHQVELIGQTGFPRLATLDVLEEPGARR
ncbi:MAG: hypothetical protein F4Y86_17270 [Gammaproteobacteria bacterium]|nr:hypothetical protein [Gammaproteobacteria bacterium]